MMKKLLILLRSWIQTIASDAFGVNLIYSVGLSAANAEVF